MSTVVDVCRFEGVFHEDKCHGRGKFNNLANGNVMEGMFYQGVARGDCKITFPSGSVFEGFILQDLTKSLESYSTHELYDLTQFYTGKISSSDGSRETFVNNITVNKLIDPFATTSEVSQ